MEIGVTILLFVCMTALLYVMLSLKITRQVDLQMKEFYKTRIHQDIQEFYREMEGYAALFEGQIQKLRSLSEVQPAIAPLPAPTPKATAAKKTTPMIKAKVPVKKQRAPEPIKVTSKPKPGARRPAPTPAPAPVELAPDDSAIAAELMRDLGTQDEFRPTRGELKKEMIKAAAMQNEPPEVGQEKITNLFSRIGRAVEPMLFGAKSEPKSAETDAIPVRRQAITEVEPKITNNFTEVLQRAKEIQEAKKAERVRSEIEARAEFYAVADTYVPQRNALAVKELDEHTKKFLIESLQSDPNYRKQALRALVENAVPIAEIARLSKIDIGELELMRQLGRF